MIHIPAFPGRKPTDEGYEHRCILGDAQRAAKMGDSPEKACSYAKHTEQYDWWMDAYAAEVLRRKVAK